MDDYEYEEETLAFAPDSEMGKLKELLPESEFKEKIISYYWHNREYLSGIVTSLKMLEHFESHPKPAYNIIKTTRAGFTTNSIISSLFKNKKILLVAPTNKILYDTVAESFDLYCKITGNISKLIRPIPNNISGCSCSINNLKNNPQLKIMPYISCDDCATCNKYNTFPIGMPSFSRNSTVSHCIVKTMLSEKDYSPELYAPDVVTITYDKFAVLLHSNNAKNSLFKEIIGKVDIIVFDEIGEYLSKSISGFEFFTEETDKFNNVSTKTPSYYINYLVEKISTIKNTSSKNIITHFFNDYITPFFEKTLTPIINLPFPKIIVNPLHYEVFDTQIKNAAKFAKTYRINKQEALARKYREYYQVIESLAIDNESPEFINLLLNLLNIISKNQLLLYDTSTVKYNPKFVSVKSLLVAPAIDTLMYNLNEWSDNNKIIIFSDATMPSYSFNSYKSRKIKNLFYGDPANNNKSCLMFHDSSITRFSKNLFFNSVKYQQALIYRIIDVLKLNYYGNSTIWVPSKDIAYSMSNILKTIGIPVCTADTPSNDAVLITYYGSTFTRGVKSDRRYQILIGKANKPKNSYKHVAFMHREAWNVISERDMYYLAEQEGVSLEEYLNILKSWSKKAIFNDKLFLSNELPSQLNKYFDILSNSIQKETTYMITWQAASRAKEPVPAKKRLNRSVNVCIGWSQQELNELLKWGSNESISYNPLTESRNFKSQKNSIPIPNIISTDNISFIRKWISGKPIPDNTIGFSDNFTDGIKELLKERSPINTEDIWLSLCTNNIDFHNNSDTHDNGYLIGALNLLTLYDYEGDIEIEKISSTDFNFYYNPSAIKSAKSYYINKIEFLQMLDILRAIYLIPETSISCSDVRKFISTKKLSIEKLKELWEIILSQNLFEGSTWHIEGNKIIKSTSERKAYEKACDLIKNRFKHYPNHFDMMSYIIEWFYMEKDVHEIDVNTLTYTVSRFSANYEFVKNLALTLLNSDEWQEFNLPIDVERIGEENIKFSRKDANI